MDSMLVSPDPSHEIGISMSLQKCIRRYLQLTDQRWGEDCSVCALIIAKASHIYYSIQSVLVAAEYVCGYGQEFVDNPNVY